MPAWCLLHAAAQRTAVAAAMLLGLVVAAPAADPTDAVAVYPAAPSSAGDNKNAGWLARPLQIIQGQIRSFDTQQLEILPPGETVPQRIAPDRIVWVRAAWDDADAAAGIAAYEQGRYAEAIAPLLAAATRPAATWRQQWLLALLASAAFESGRYPAALELINQLARSDLPAPLYDLLPICYTVPPAAVQASDAARPQLASAQPLVRLVAASILLSGADAAAAERVLQQLAVDTQHPLVARLADALLWRRTPPPQVASAAPQWWRKIDGFPPAVASGPMTVAADRLEAAGLNDEALQAWLTIELLASGNGPRAVLAHTRSAALLPAGTAQQPAAGNP